MINVHEAAWKYYNQGVINAQEAEYYARSLCKLIGRHAELIAAWRSTEEDRLPGFYEYVDSVCGL